VLAQVEERILHCFHHGGGVPYEAYHRFHEVMAEESGQTVVAALHDIILPMVPGLRERLRIGIQVLDVGCGSGRALNEMARTFPDSRFVGYDLCHETVRKARAEAQASGLTNVAFETRDVSKFRDGERFDLVTAFDAIHDQARPSAVLTGIRTALEADGMFLMQDIRSSSHLENNLDNPMATFIYSISCMHCMTVSLSQGGEGLGAAWGQEKALRMLKQAGFHKVQINQLPHDPMNDYYLAMAG
jgi:2-polyprenyl-3-methyl-5-hydroxy-6-metoxy-1,4-benzoquinol methylase